MRLRTLSSVHRTNLISVFVKDLTRHSDNANRFQFILSFDLIQWIYEERKTVKSI